MGGESAQDTGKRLHRDVDLLGRHIEVCDGPEAGDADRIDQHAFLLQCADDGRCGEPVADHIEDHNVRVDVLGVDRDRRNLLQLAGETLGILVVVFRRPT